MEETSKTPSPSASIWLPLLGATLLAFAVRSYGLSSQVFTNDEVVDLQIARESWTAILYKADGFPPLHHLILKVVLGVTQVDMSARWLSVIYGVLAVPLCGLIGQRLAGRHCGIVAAWLMAITPMHVYFCQEGRSYSLYFLLVALATWLFWRALQIGTPRAWAAFALVASLGGYAHYYFCFVLVAFAVIWLKQVYATREWRAGLVAFLGLSLLQIPLFIIVGADIECQQSMLQNSFSLISLGYTGWAMFTGLCLGPSSRELHSMGSTAAIQAILPWLPVVLIGCAGIFVRLLRREHPHRVELLTLFLLPILGASVLAAGFQLSSYNIRYVIASLLPFVMLQAIAVTSSKHQSIGVLLACVLLVLSGTSIFNRQSYAKYQNEDTMSACEFIVEQSDGQPERVLTISHYMKDVAAYYLPEEYPVDEILDVTSEPETFVAAIQLINSEPGPYWIFYSREFHGDADGIFQQALLNIPQITHQGTWAGVELYRGTAPLNLPSKRLSP